VFTLYFQKLVLIILQLLSSQLYNFITHSTCSQQVFVGKNICLEHLVANLNPFKPMLGAYPLWQFTTTGSDSTSKDPNPTLTKIMEPSNNQNLQIRG